MKNYNVTITGQQAHIKGNEFQNQTQSQVKSIIEKYHDATYPMPQMDGNSYELNGDLYIKIEEC